MTDRIKGITVVIGGDTSPLSAAMKKVNGEISKTQTELKDINRLLKVDPGNMTLLGQKTSLLGHEIDVTKNKLKALQQAEKQVQRQFKEGKISQEEYRGLQREIIATQQKLKGLELEAAKSNKVIAGVSTATEKFGKNAEKVGNAIMPVSAATAAVGAASVKASMNFEDAMSQVAGALDRPQSQMDSLNKLAIKMGADTQFSASEAAEAMVELAKGGLSEADIKTGALKSTMDLAAASGMSLSDASNTIVQSMGAFGLSAQNSAQAANALAGSAAASSTDVAPLTQGLAQCSAQAHLAGWNIQDTTGVLGMFADASVNGADAGTSLKTMLQRLSAPTGDAAKLMKAYGINVRNSNGTMKSASEVAQILHDKLGKLSPAARDAALQTIFGSDASRAAAIMMDNGAAGLVKYTKATYDQTSASRLANSQMGNTHRAVEELRGSLDTAGIEIGKVIAPSIHDAAVTIKDLVNKFTDLPEGTKKAIVGIGGVVVATGPLLTIIGKVSQGISAFTGGPLAKLLKKNIALADSAKATGKAFSGITGKDLAPQLDSKRKAKKVLKEQEPEVSAPKVKNSKGASQSAKKTARDIDTELSKAGKKAGTQVQKNVEALAARIKAGGKPAIAAAKSVLDKIDKALGTAGKNAGNKASTEVEDMGTKIKEAGKSPKNAAKEVMDGIDDNLSGGKGGKKAGTGIVKSVSELGGEITGAGGTAVNSAGKLSKDIEHGLSSGGGKKVGAEVVDAVKKLGPEITSSGLPAITSAGGLSKNINSKLSGSGEGIGGKLLSGVKSLGGKITSSGAGAAASAEGLSKNISGKLSGGSGGIGGRLLSGIKSLGGKITSSGTGAVAATGGITTKISGLFSSLGSGLTAKVPGIAGAFGRIGGAFKALGVTMMANPFTIVIAAIAGLAVALVTAYNKCAWFRDAVNGIWNGIKSVASTVWNGISGVIGGAANGIKSLISGDFNGARTAATNAMSTLRSAAGTIFGGIKSTIGNAANGAKNLAVSAFQSLNNATGGKLGNLGSIVSKGISSAFSGFRSLGGNMFKWGSEAIGNLVKGIQSMIGNVGNAVKSVGDKIRSFLHFSRPDEGPLRDIDTWMPDMMSKLSGGITGNQGMVQKAVAGVAKSMVIDPAILNPKATVNAQVSTAAVAAGTESGSNMGTGIKFENVQFNLPNVREPKDFAPSLLQQLGQEWVGRKAAYARTGK